MSWLVTGGAGYIGAHVVRAFQEVGLEAVVIDDLSSGHRGFVQPEVPFVEGSIVDTELVIVSTRVSWSLVRLTVSVSPLRVGCTFSLVVRRLAAVSSRMVPALPSRAARRTTR